MRGEFDSILQSLLKDVETQYQDIDQERAILSAEREDFNEEKRVRILSFFFFLFFSFFFFFFLFFFFFFLFFLFLTL